MAHATKFTATQSKAMFEHYDRTRYEGYTRQIENADSKKNYTIPNERTPQNYNLAVDLQPLPQGEFLQKRLSEVKHINRADIVTSVDWVITKPQDVEPFDEEIFFKACFDFCCSRYGAKNVISAYVHKDEVTPHLHFSFVPVLRFAEVEKLNAKKVLTRQDLQSFHENLSDFVDERLGYHVSILNGATENGNLTLNQLRNGTREARSEYQTAQKELAEVKESTAQAHFEAVKHLETAVSDLSVEIPDGAKKVRKGLGKRRKEYVLITPEAWNNHAANAETVQKVRAAIDWYKDTPTGKRTEQMQEAFNQAYKREHKRALTAETRVAELEEALKDEKNLSAINEQYCTKIAGEYNDLLDYCCKRIGVHRIDLEREFKQDLKTREEQKRAWKEQQEQEQKTKNRGQNKPYNSR